MRGIYSITNQITNQCYIGSSVNILKRWNEHKNTLRRNIHKNPHLQNAWNKYGESSFVFSVMELTDDLIVRETYYLQNIKNLYNISLFADNPTRGRHLSESHKQKLRKPKKDTTKMGRAPGFHHSDEWKSVISTKLLGRKYNGDRRGEFASRKKLTKEEVIEIRSLYKTGYYSHKQLSNMFDLKSSNTVGNILNNKSWSNV